jgi:hypothetical protein
MSTRMKGIKLEAVLGVFVVSGLPFFFLTRSLPEKIDRSQSFIPNLSGWHGQRERDGDAHLSITYILYGIQSTWSLMEKLLILNIPLSPNHYTYMYYHYSLSLLARD